MATRIQTLSIRNHDRDSAGLRYVYPVVSRRAGGVSIGINLNPNNACNWACLYCQVPDLTLGGPPPLDLGLLERELNLMLADIQSGRFVSQFMAENAVGQPYFKATRRMNDAHQIEEVGEKLRGMMPWISAGKMVDKSRN